MHKPQPDGAHHVIEQKDREVFLELGSDGLAHVLVTAIAMREHQGMRLLPGHRNVVSLNSLHEALQMLTLDRLYRSYGWQAIVVFSG
jgi:hypothetical protein